MKKHHEITLLGHKSCLLRLSLESDRTRNAALTWISQSDHYPTWHRVLLHVIVWKIFWIPNPTGSHRVIHFTISIPTTSPLHSHCIPSMPYFRHEVLFIYPDITTTSQAVQANRALQAVTSHTPESNRE